MPITNFKDYSKGKLTVDKVEKKKTKDQNGGDVNYVKVTMKYDHPVGSGTTRGKPTFELCECQSPRGLQKKGYKLSGLVTFDINNKDDTIRQEVLDCVDTEERSQITGWIKCDDLVEIKGRVAPVATTIGEVSVHLNSDDSSTVITTIPTGTTLPIEKETDDGVWLLIKYGGSNGFLSQLYNDMAKIVFDNRNACGLQLDTLDKVKTIMKNPVYWHRDPETNKFMDNKLPQTYFKYTYFQATPATDSAPAKPERYVDFKVPGTNESLNLEVLQRSAIKFRPAIYLSHIYVSTKEIIPQIYISSAVVTGVSKIEREHIQQETLSKYTQNKEMLERIKKEVEASKEYVATTPTRPVEEESPAPTGGDHGQNHDQVQSEIKDVASMLEGGPVQEVVNLDKVDDEDDDLAGVNLPTL